MVQVIVVHKDGGGKRAVREHLSQVMARSIDGRTKKVPKRAARRVTIEHDIRSFVARTGHETSQPGGVVAGLDANPPDDCYVVHDRYNTPAHGQVLHAQQYFRGLRVYRAARVIRIDGERVTGSAPLYQLPKSIETKATTTPSQALAGALKFLEARHAVRKGGPLRVLRETRFGDLAGAPTVIEASRALAGPARLHLEVFPNNQGEAELAWVIQAELKGGMRCECVVSARRKKPRVLLCTQTNICASFNATWVRLPSEVPRVDRCPIGPIATPTGAPGAPSVWLSAGASAEGPNVSCHQGGRSNAEILGSPTADTVFVWCNLLRDFFHEFGFEGELYGFEGDDPLWTRRYSRQLDLGAEFKPDSDGHKVFLDFYDSPWGGSHACIDPGIVIHEYTHAVTNRLLGGAMLSNPFFSTEGKGLDEGYSDYFALTIMEYLRRQNNLPLAPRVLGGGFHPLTGVRDYSAFSGTWNDRLRDRYDIGKVWCAALLEARDDIARRSSEDAADRFMWQALVVSLKEMLPVSPAVGRLTLAHAKDALMSATTTLAVGAMGHAPASVQTAFTLKNL